MNNKTYIVDPLFKRGVVPGIPHAEIQDILRDKCGNYRYFVCNKYNAWASGWTPEDMLVRMVSENQKTIVHPPQPPTHE